MVNDDRITYVIDTSVLLDYPDIIPQNGSMTTPEKPTINLDGAHLVIPTAVVRELASFENEKSERGLTAKLLLRRISKIVGESKITIAQSYHLDKPVPIAHGRQELSILPVHAGFKKALPFQPDEDDLDGQIILTALTAAFLKAGIPTDGSAVFNQYAHRSYDGIILLTNQHDLAIRATERGINTSRYGYKHPEPYTGRRDLVVPKELFELFYYDKRLERRDFEELMPNERKLVANEFVVMKLADDKDYPKGYDPKNDPYYINIGRYDQVEDAILPLKYVTRFPIGVKSPGQAIYAEALLMPEVAAVICTGPAGSGKTYMATVYGYEACRNGEYISVTMIPCEDTCNIGALPGDLDEKMEPDIQIIKNALRNYLLNEKSKYRKELDNLKKFKAVSNKDKSGFDDPGDETPCRRSIKERLNDQVDLIWKNWFSCIPVQKARGRDFSHEIAFYDEFQDQSVAQADTLIKRVGEDGKIIVAGDLEQQRAPHLDHTNNGLVYASQLLYDDPMVAQVHLNEDEVVRHPLVKLIAMRQKAKSLLRDGKVND